MPTARHLVTKCSCWPPLSQAHLLEGHGHLSKPPQPQVWGTGTKPERADWEVPDWTSALLRSPWGRAHGHGSLLSLLSRNGRRKDASKCFWLPQPGCLSVRSADTPEAKLGAEGLPSKSSAGILWGEAMVSKGTKWPAKDTSRWCPDKPGLWEPGLSPGETSSERAAALWLRQEPDKENWGWLASLQMNDRDQRLQCWGRAVYTGVFTLHLDKLGFGESGWFLPQFLPASKGDNHPEDC